jgi:NAD(P)-dependent dehydrogenase (short-subunit alcohol dehydrogenase family)
MRCIVAGTGSDIVRELTQRLVLDGWEVVGTTGRSMTVPNEPWDVLIVAQGSLEPIGKFFECSAEAWWDSVCVNAMFPLLCVRQAWHKRNPGATVVFIGGPNLKHPTPTYTAYRAGKAVIHALVETLGAEYPDTKFRLFHPGVVKTKIHYQTINAGARAGNFQRVMGIVNGLEKTVSHDQVYEKFKSLLEEK